VPNFAAIGNTVNDLSRIFDIQYGGTNNHTNIA